MEDYLYDSLSSRYTKALARAMAYTKQVKAASLLNTGFDTFQSGDGVTLLTLHTQQLVAVQTLTVQRLVLTLTRLRLNKRLSTLVDTQTNVAYLSQLAVKS